MDVFSDPPVLLSPPSELTLSGELVVVDVSLAHPGSAIARIRVAYGPEGTADEGIERVLTRALDGIDSADWLVQQAALERFRRALDALVVLEKAGIEAFAASAALAAAFEREEATVMPPIPLRGELGHPYLSFVLHADAIVRVSDAWQTAAATAFAGAGLEALVRSRADGIVLGRVKPLGTAFQLRLDSPVPLCDRTARQLAAVLGVALADGGSPFGKASASGPFLHELIVRLLVGDAADVAARRGWLRPIDELRDGAPLAQLRLIWQAFDEGSPSFSFRLSGASTRGHLLTALRFATAGQLAAAVNILATQCRDNELVRSCFSGPLVRRSARVLAPAPSLDDLLGGAPPTIRRSQCPHASKCLF